MTSASAKYIAVLLAFCLLTCTFFACGKDHSDQSNSATQQAAVLAAQKAREEEQNHAERVRFLADMEAMQADAQDNNEDFKLIITADSTPDSYGATHTAAYAGTYIFDYDSEEAMTSARNGLKADRSVSSVMENRDVVFTLMESSEAAAKNKELAAMNWGVAKVGFDELKESIETTKDMKPSPKTVAVIDTGAEQGNPYIAERLVSGYDFVDQDDDPEDETTNDNFKAHGTHVAGIVAACTTDDVSIMPLRIMNKDGQAQGDAVYYALVYAIDQKVDVINLSLGVPDNGYTFLDSVMDNALEKGMVIVTAAGNSKVDVSTIYPQNNGRSIVISGTEKDDTGYTNSNYGSAITFSAPARDITSTVFDDGMFSSVFGRTTYTADKTGTSMAAPFATAACAQLKTLDPSLDQEALIEEISTNDVVDLGKAGKDDIFGYGRLDFHEFDVKKTPAYRTVESSSSSSGSSSSSSSTEPSTVIPGPLNALTIRQTATTSDGSTLPETTFTYQFERLDGTDFPLDAITGKAGETLTLSDVDFGMPGTYRYRLTQQKPADEHWSHDETAYLVTIRADSDEDGTGCKAQSISVVKESDPSAKTEPVFENTYTPETKPALTGRNRRNSAFLLGGALALLVFCVYLADRHRKKNGQMPAEPRL